MPGNLEKNAEKKIGKKLKIKIRKKSSVIFAEAPLRIA